MRRIGYIIGDSVESARAARRAIEAAGVKLDEMVNEHETGPFLSRSGAKAVIRQTPDTDIALYTVLGALGDLPSAIVQAIDHLHALGVTVVAVDYSDQPVAATLQPLKSAVRAFARVERDLEAARDQLDHIQEWTSEELERRVRAGWKAFESLYEGGPSAIIDLITRPPIDTSRAKDAQPDTLPEVVAVLEKARKERGLTYDAAAELIGRSKGATYRAFRTGHGPTARLLMDKLVVEPRLQNSGVKGGEEVAASPSAVSAEEQEEVSHG